MARKRKVVESAESTIVQPQSVANDKPAERGRSAVAEPIVPAMSKIADESDPVSRPDASERIALRAYEIYLARGGNHGQDLEDWLEAERQMSERPERPIDD
jgi:hypothetical protein